MMADRKANSDYFVCGNYLLCAIVLFGFYCLGIAICGPKSVPGFLGPFGDLLKGLSQNYSKEVTYLAYLIIGLHILESIYAYTLCRQFGLSTGSTIKWCLQTMLFGYISLRELHKYKPRSGKKSPTKSKRS